MPSKYWLRHSSQESRHLLSGSFYPTLTVILTLKLAEITKFSISFLASLEYNKGETEKELEKKTRQYKPTLSLKTCFPAVLTVMENKKDRNYDFALVYFCMFWQCDFIASFPLSSLPLNHGEQQGPSRPWDKGQNRGTLSSLLDSQNFQSFLSHIFI